MMTDKQKKIIRQLLNEHLIELDEMLKDFEENPHTVASVKEEIEACEEALKLVSKE